VRYDISFAVIIATKTLQSSEMELEVALKEAKTQTPDLPSPRGQ
jgi:hypothetical protein